MPNNWTVDDIHELANDILLQSQGGDVSPDLSDYVGVYALNADLFESVSGNPIVIEEAREQAVMKLTAELPYKADGYTGLTVTRTGKNLIGKSASNTGEMIASGVTFTFENDGSVTLNGTATQSIYPVLFSPTDRNVTNAVAWSGWDVAIPYPAYNAYYWSAITSGNASAAPSVNLGIYTDSSNYSNKRANTVIFGAFRVSHVSLVIPSGTSFTDYNIKWQLEPGSSTTSYEPYNALTYSVSVGESVYGGTLDVTTGTLTSTLAADGSPLAEPVIYQQEPQAVTLLDGYNVIYSDAGNLEMSYRR